MKELHWHSLFVLLLVSLSFQPLWAQEDQRGEALLKETINSVKALNPDGNLLSFAFITDTHQRGFCAQNRYASRNIKLFSVLCNSGLCTFAVHGGDFFNAYNCTHDSAVSYLKQARAGFDLKIPFYTTKGNHDCNGKYHQAANLKRLDWKHQHYGTYNLLTRRYTEVDKADWDGKESLYLMTPDTTAVVSRYEYYDIFQRGLQNVISNPADSCCNYYYTDLDAYKIRIIILNDFDAEQLEVYGIHQLQAEWLQRVALNFSDKVDPSSWGACLFVHNVRLDPKELLNQVLVDFRQHPERGYLVGCFHGHTHINEFDHRFGYNNIGVERGYCDDLEKGTDNELMFDVFTIDTTKRVLYETRLGRGESRMFGF